MLVLRYLLVSTFIASGLAAIVMPRAQTTCHNEGTPRNRLGNADLIKKGCDPSKKSEWRSSHNCNTKGGKAYLCVTGSGAVCISGGAIKSQNMEGGECFY
ncbi:hypothetical protein BDQ12DRAFT_691226 [Crucibulum laeve]|uniref:Secreted protein n=1 Tax=Crucibulum laeve TaxID=68775 RepID=A0A5C3LN78_9AGAR|nr:hypothetical protein BDQ12DRAFT_691226 [Crucibulum laeve]